MPTDTDLSSLNWRLAEKAGWRQVTADVWMHDGKGTLGCPDYTGSIDAQHRDLDPLVEAICGVFDEQTTSLTPPLFTTFVFPRSGYGGVSGTGPTRAAARAAAIDEALT